MSQAVTARSEVSRPRPSAASATILFRLQQRGSAHPRCCSRTGISASKHCPRSREAQVCVLEGLAAFSARADLKHCKCVFVPGRLQGRDGRLLSCGRSRVHNVVRPHGNDLTYVVTRNPGSPGVLEDLSRALGLVDAKELSSFRVPMRHNPTEAIEFCRAREGPEARGIDIFRRGTWYRPANVEQRHQSLPGGVGWPVSALGSTGSSTPWMSDARTRKARCPASLRAGSLPVRIHVLTVWT